jgi:hypothetical protein
VIDTGIPGYTFTIESRSRKMISGAVTREEIEEEMDELAREYVETHDPEIPFNEKPSLSSN